MQRTDPTPTRPLSRKDLGLLDLTQQDGWSGVTDLAFNER